MKVRDMLNKCQNNDERYVLVYMMASEVTRRFVGNEFNGWTVLDFVTDGIGYTYSPRQGAGGDGEWYVTPNSRTN